MAQARLESHHVHHGGVATLHLELTFMALFHIVAKVDILIFVSFENSCHASGESKVTNLDRAVVV